MRIESHYVDALGQKHRAPRRTLAAIREAGQKAGDASAVIVVTEGEAARVGRGELQLEDGTRVAVAGRLPRDVPAGYHQLHREGHGTVHVLVAPASCYLPESLEIWGWAIQLYAARSRRSWGIGDFADLRRLGRWASKDGAGIALINPLAAATPVVPQQASPYFPSTRRFRSPLYLRVEEVDGAEALGDFAALAARARALNTVRRIDRDEVYRLKMNALERAWEVVRFRDVEAFDRYRAERGDALREFATFCALAERFKSGWRTWPADFRHPSSEAVRDAARRRPMADRIMFHQWVQYQIDRQLSRATADVPVMQDLPIGFDPDGADAWAFQDVLAQGITVGAPPDEFNTKGQNWGLPPFVPNALRSAAYRPFIDTIRACVRQAGGLRIDHVMGLFRLFWIPEGSEPKDGAYVRGYPDDLLAIVAIESQRAKAFIVGEDLGTVEESARERLMARRILSYRLLWFEKVPPRKFPREALAAVTTHDLPTVAGLWGGSDLEAQKKAGLSPNEKGTRDIHRRVARLARATARTPVRTVIARVHEGLAEAPSRIITATLDDAMAVEERPNMPATSDEWPNWSLALPEPIETLETSPLARRIARALSKRRGIGRR
jgi:4-alpha-glucanotransferase